MRYQVTIDLEADGYDHPGEVAETLVALLEIGPYASTWSSADLPKRWGRAVPNDPEDDVTSILVVEV